MHESDSEDRRADRTLVVVLTLFAVAEAVMLAFVIYSALWRSK